MKIRMNGNSIRYRISKSEVDKLCAKGLLENEINFGGSTLKYTLQSQQHIGQISAVYENNQISILIPAANIIDWNSNDVVGFKNSIKLSDTQDLHILIEKDFKCIDNSAEDQSDNYDNPNLNC